MAGFTNDVAVARETSRVRLLGSGLRDYVAFAVTNRPSVEAARLAVSNAALALVTATSDQYLQMSLSGGYSQSTANAHEFSWHQRRGKGTADVSFDLLICDFGRIDARERAAREELASAKRSLVEAELEVFNEVCQAYFAVMRSDALLEVARTNEFMHAEHLRQAESLFGAGEAKKLDVLKARVRHLEEEQRRERVIPLGALVPFSRLLNNAARRAGGS
jgi:outer membrane protein TolC